MGLVLTVDVGITTGLVVSATKPREIPKIKRSLAYTYSGLIRDEIDKVFADFIQPDTTDQKYKYIVVEYPIYDRKSDNTALVTKIRSEWEAAINTYAETESIPVISIAPTQWKSTPSRKLNIFKMQGGFFAKSYRPTRHEQDAACIAHWFSFYSRLGT